MPDRVRITDVSPRDGLQNEPGVIPTLDKAILIKQLCRTGVDEIEVTSFVSPRWVPQLGDGPQVLRAAADAKDSSVLFSALVPNKQGMEAALAAMRAAQPEVRSGEPARALDRIAVFTAASETFSHRNTNASIADSIRRFAPVVVRAKQNGLSVRGYISCVIACPFEGPIPPEKVASIASLLLDVGVDEIDLGDTIGVAESETIAILLNAILGRLGDAALKYTTLHLHDTNGRAADCVREALQLGIRSFDGSVAGLGGCPYASTPTRRAPGNISTELLVRTVEEAGFQTGVDMDRLKEAAAYASGIVAKSRAATGGAT
jgi:hydroxymethylglutaryl-CoA lyase